VAIWQLAGHFPKEIRMKQTFLTLRYLVSTLAVSLAFSLVCLAQQTSGAKPAEVTMNKSAASDHVAMMIADWTRARDYTKEYLDAMPEDGLSFKPSPDIRSFAEQMLHLANANYMFAATATGGANPMQGKNMEKMEEYKTKAALTKAVLDSYDYVITSIKGMDAKKGEEGIKLFNRYDSTRMGTIHKAFEHQTHHRGQTTIYLRLKGVKPPAEKLF
jgi:uncharacterized damage-inducible protein DinB